MCETHRVCLVSFAHEIFFFFSFLLRIFCHPLPVVPSEQIYSGGQFLHFIDGHDVRHSNWMRFVNPARSLAEQNLVACQNGQDIYFYTMKPVQPQQELLVWYSQEFSQRLRCQTEDEKQHLKHSKSTSTPCGNFLWTLWGLLLFFAVALMSRCILWFYSYCILHIWKMIQRKVSLEL